jgi:hypothetical protein
MKIIDMISILILIIMIIGVACFLIIEFYQINSIATMSMFLGFTSLTLGLFNIKYGKKLNKEI